MTEPTPEIPPNLYDAAGNEYVPRHPAPGLVSIALCPAELLELWHWFACRAATAAATGNVEWWEGSERAASERLAWAVALCPELAGFQRQSPGVSTMEGTA